MKAASNFSATFWSLEAEAGLVFVFSLEVRGKSPDGHKNGRSRQVRSGGSRVRVFR